MALNKQNPFYQKDLQNILKVKNIRSLNGKSILITGATGLIGVQMIDALMLLNKSGCDINIYAVGRNKEKASSRLGEYYSDSHFTFIQKDVQSAFPKSLKVDFIIPGASNTHPLAYSRYPIETMLINMKGAEHALNLAVECGAIVLYISSVEVYGNATGADIFTEDYTGKLDLSTSRACYTESKRACEALCQSYIAERDASVKIARLSRVFGPSLLEMDSKASSQFIKKALAKEDIVLKSKGEQFYSYTYVADAVNALLYIMVNGKNGVPYNISNELCNIHLKDFAQLCADCAGTNVVFDLPSETERKGYSVAMHAILDNTRLKSIGWMPLYEIKDALSRTITILADS